MAEKKTGRDLGFYFVASIGRRGRVSELIGDNGDIDPRSGEKVEFCTRSESLNKAVAFAAKAAEKDAKADAKAEAKEEAKTKDTDIKAEAKESASA